MTNRWRTLVAASVLALGLAACGGSADPDPETVAGVGDATTTTGGDASDGSGGSGRSDGGGSGSGGDASDGSTGAQAGGDGVVATTAPSGGAGSGSGAGGSGGAKTTTTVRRSGGGGSSSADPAQPTAAGTYRYDNEGEATTFGSTGPVPEVTTLVVDPPDGTRQRSVSETRDEDGNGSRTTTVADYRGDGVYLVSLKTENKIGAISSTYEFRPSSPQLVAPTGAEVGDRLSFRLRSTDGGLTADVTITWVKEEQVSAAGTTVETVLVRTHTEISGDYDGELTTDANVSPRHGISVRNHSTSDIRTAFGRFTSDSVGTLRSLQPS